MVHEKMGYLPEGPISSDGGGGIEFPEFIEEKDMEKAELKLGMIFSSAAQFRAALRKHCIINRTDFRFL